MSPKEHDVGKGKGWGAKEFDAAWSRDGIQFLLEGAKVNGRVHKVPEARTFFALL